jgi:hypothetical protein
MKEIILVELKPHFPEKKKSYDTREFHKQNNMMNDRSLFSSYSENEDHGKLRNT